MEVKPPSDPNLAWQLTIAGWQFAGAIVGSVMTFLVAWPTGWRDFATRAVVSISSGVLFGPIVRDHFGWAELPPFILASSAVTSLFAWSVIGMVMRIIGTTNKLPFGSKDDRGGAEK